MKLFERRQAKNKKTDIVFSNARALIARLPKNPVLPETIHLLNHSFESFTKLIELTRNFEQNMFEKKVPCVRLLDLINTQNTVTTASVLVM